MAAQHDADDFLARHRAALVLVARMQMPPWLRSKVDSSDVVQQTMLEAHRELGRLQAMSDVEQARYLRRSLSHNLIDLIRKFELNRAEVDVQQSSARLEAWLVAEESAPSMRLAREEHLQQLATALATLPENQRVAVELKHLHGLAVREIAAQMGCTELAVGGLLRRGIRALRERLGAFTGGSDVGASA